MVSAKLTLLFHMIANSYVVSLIVITSNYTRYIDFFIIKLLDNHFKATNFKFRYNKTSISRFSIGETTERRRFDVSWGNDKASSGIQQSVSRSAPYELPTTYVSPHEEFTYQAKTLHIQHNP